MWSIQPWLAGCAALFMAVSARAEDAYVFPFYANGAQVEQACESFLTDARTQVQVLQKADPDSTFLSKMDAMTRRYEDTVGPLSLLTAVHPEKSIRDAAEGCELRYQSFSSEFFQNARIYRVLRGLRPSDEIDRRYQRDLLDSFEDAGVRLTSVNRAKAKFLANDITRLSQKFDRRIREDKRRVAFTTAELEGVPASVWKGAPVDKQGRHLIGLDAPSYQPVMQSATQESTRERLWLAFLTQGGTSNLTTLSRLSERRRAYAKLFGFDSYADFVLRRRMAQSPAEAARFLRTVQTAVERRERQDLDVLRADKILLSGKADAVLNRWDVQFHSERVRQARFNVDQEQFRRHFPPDASLDFVFRLAERMFGVKFEQQKQTLWHSDVRAYAVRDQSDQRHLGTLFVDLYPREDKYNHAAVWSFRNVSSLSGRSPAAALVVNFNREGLGLDELETLLHEFGHALHSLLSNTRYASHGGTSTQLDFVEAPSQMLEDWVYDPAVLALFQDVCAKCEPVPADMIARARQARDFGKGLQVARQRLFASYDLALYGSKAHDPLALWKRMEGETPLGHAAGSMFPAGFGHIAGGYAAGYYSYLWSLVLAEDLRTGFASDKLSAATGRRYREEVLSQGGQVPPAVLVRHFLDRETNSEAFFKALER